MSDEAFDLKARISRLESQNDRMRLIFASIREWMQAEREREEPKDGWYDRFVVFCRETKGPCFCGCHISQIND
jgi:hypothetical protein